MNKLKADAKSVVLSYFCDHHLSSGNDLGHVLRSLAIQLVRYDTNLSTLVWDQYVRRGLTSSVENMRKLLPDLLSAVPCPNLVLDGLDECQETEQRFILKELLSLCENSHALNLLVSSRDGGFIASKLRRKPTVSLRDEHTAVEGDIACFVKARLQPAVEELGILIPVETAQRVEEELIRCSNGEQPLSIETHSY